MAYVSKFDTHATEVLLPRAPLMKMEITFLERLSVILYSLSLSLSDSTLIHLIIQNPIKTPVSGRLDQLIC